MIELHHTNLTISELIELRAKVLKWRPIADVILKLIMRQKPIISVQMRDLTNSEDVV